MRREVAERERAIDQLCETVVFPVSVAVGRKDVLHVELKRVGVAAGLLHALERVVAFLLGFEHCHRHGLWGRADLTHSR